MAIPNALPCPFCGGIDLHLTSNGMENNYVGCNTCGAEGPAHEDDATALAGWNQRSARGVRACPRCHGSGQVGAGQLGRPCPVCAAGVREEVSDERLRQLHSEALDRVTSGLRGAS